MDSSLLDVFADNNGETPKKKPTSSWSFSKDIVKHLAIVTPNSGRVDATKSLSSNTGGISDGTLRVTYYNSRGFVIFGLYLYQYNFTFKKRMPPYGAYNFIKCKYMGSMCNSYYLVLWR